MKPTDPLIYDVIATHLYWIIAEDQNFKLDIRSQLETLAAAVQFFRQHGKPKILLLTGKIFGSNFPSVSEIAKKELVERFNIPPSDILLLFDNGLDAVETIAEMDGIKLVANKFRFGKIMEIAEPAQAKTIKLMQNKMNRFIKTDIRSADEILLGKVRSPLEDFRNSKYELQYRLYEWLKRKAIELNFIEKITTAVGKSRNGPKRHLPWPFSISPGV